MHGYACSQYGVDAVLKLIWVSARCHTRLGGLTNSLTTLEEPFSASLCTLEESLLEDFDFDFDVVADFEDADFEDADFEVDDDFDAVLDAVLDDVFGSDVEDVGIVYGVC